jgi:hypothetical protein
VWKLKAVEPHQIWNLNFKSVSMIEPSKTENQFYIAMAASDETGEQADSILLF